jgi:hypothetical protein
MKVKAQNTRVFASGLMGAVSDWDRSKVVNRKRRLEPDALSTFHRSYSRHGNCKVRIHPKIASI